MHPAQDVLLTQFGALRIDDRVVGRGRLGQAGQHRCFGNRNVLQRLAEVNLGGRGKTIGALPEENLVDVQLENLVLGKIVFDLEGEQDFIQFAGIGLFRRQEEIARDLLGDGRCALALASAKQVAARGAQNAEVVDAAMLVETIILGRDDGVLHDLRHFLDAHHGAAFFAKLANQVAIGCVDAQRNLRAIVGQHFQRRQVGVGQDQHDHGNGNADSDKTDDENQRIQYGAKHRIER